MNEEERIALVCDPDPIDPSGHPLVMVPIDKTHLPGENVEVAETLRGIPAVAEVSKEVDLVIGSDREVPVPDKNPVHLS